MAAITQHGLFVGGAGSATLSTALSNGTTAITTGVTNAKGVPNVVNNSITVTGPSVIFDGTLYVAFATIVYNTYA